MTHDVTNIGNDRKQLSKMSKQARKVMEVEALTVVADRGYYNGEELLSCHEEGIMTYAPNSATSGALAAGRFSRSEFHYDPETDVYRCPAGERNTGLTACLFNAISGVLCFCQAFLGEKYWTRTNL